MQTRVPASELVPGFDLGYERGRSAVQVPCSVSSFFSMRRGLGEGAIADLDKHFAPAQGPSEEEHLLSYRWKQVGVPYLPVTVLTVLWEIPGAVNRSGHGYP